MLTSDLLRRLKSSSSLTQDLAPIDLLDFGMFDAQTWLDSTPQLAGVTGNLLDRTGTIDGSGPDNQVLTGSDEANTFLFDLSAKSGRDTIVNFQKHDVLMTTRKLFDSDGNGVVTFGSDRKLGLDGRSSRDTVDIVGLSPTEGLRYLGTGDGIHVYADASVRPLRAIEGTVASDIMMGDADGRRTDVLFFDTALGLHMGDDAVLRFEARDLFVTTTALDDAAPGDVLALGDEGLVDLGEATDGTVLGTVRLGGMDGAAIAALEYDRAVTRGGVTYHVYSLVGRPSAPVTFSSRGACRSRHHRRLQAR